MLHRSSPIKLLLFSGIVSVLGVLVFVKLITRGTYEYVPGHTYDYQPPVGESRYGTSEALREWQGDDQAKGAVIFTPEVAPGAALGLGVRVSHTRFDAAELGTVHAAVAVRAPQEEVREGSPLRIALVIDRSGSMHGHKFEQARAAGHKLVDALGERDSLAIVSYGSDVIMSEPLQPVTRQTRSEFHAALDRMHVDGGTNLSGGYEAALDVLVPASPEAINRVILLSDGQATEGIVNQEELAAIVGAGLERGVSLSTMGVGLDYDEVLMQLLARNGAGNYYFIEDAGQIGRLLEREFQGLMASVARNTELRFSLPQGARIAQIDGFAFRREGTSYVVDLDAFSAEQQKDLLLEIEVEPGLRGRVELLETTLVYDDVQRARVGEQRIVTDVLVDDGPVAADEVVLRRAQQIRTARAFVTAMNAYDRGDRHAAAEVLREQRRENREFLEGLGIEDPAFERVDEKMEQLARDLETVQRQSIKGKWLRKSHYDYANSAVQSSVVF